MLSPGLNAVLAVGGTLLVLATMLDLVWTTMSLHRAGPITRAVSHGLWSALRWLGRVAGSRRVLVPAGPALLFGSLAGWVLLLWIGWGLIFLSGGEAVLTTPARLAGSVVDRVYFTGFTISTLGVGDVVPGAGRWQVLTAVAAFSGLVAITVGITYVLAVLSAAVQMRQLARYITSLGTTPGEMLANGWTGRDFAPLAGHLQALTPLLLQVVQQHRAYPILRYFGTGSPALALPPAIAMLDEALTLLEAAVTPRLRPPELTLRPLRIAVRELLDDVSPAAPAPAEDVPPPPALDGLRDAGIEVVDAQSFSATLEQHRARRRRLLSVLRYEGWEWASVTDPGWRGSGR